MRTIVTLLAAAFVLLGCNTVRGMGQDIQKAGEAIEDATKRK